MDDSVSGPLQKAAATATNAMPAMADPSKMLHYPTSSVYYL